MKLVYLLCFCSYLAISLAYPGDYDEETFQAAAEALKNLSQALSINLDEILTSYNLSIPLLRASEVKKFEAKYETFSEYFSSLLEIGEAANANTTICTEQYPLVPLQEFIDSLDEKCVSPATDFGENLKSAEQSLLDGFREKYNTLANNYHWCIAPLAPEKYICVPVVTSTILEVKRILPEIEMQPVRMEVDLNRQLLILAKCADDFLSVFTNSLQIWSENVKTCILNQLNAL